jgi:hypothetical protein
VTAWLACAAALASGAATLGARDPLPGLAGSAALVPLLAVASAGLLDGVARAGRPRAVEAALVTALLAVSLGGAMDLRVFARHQRTTHDVTLAPLGRWMRDWRGSGSLVCDAPGAVAYYARWRTTPIGAAAARDEAADIVMLTSRGIFNADLDEEQARVAASLGGRYRVLGAVRRDWTRDRSILIYAHESIPALTEAEVKSFPQGIGTVARVNG